MIRPKRWSIIPPGDVSDGYVAFLGCGCRTAEHAPWQQVRILDVRPEAEFKQGHLPCAVNVPLSKLARWLKGVCKKTEIIAYCRGPYCVLSFEAVAQLRAHGFKARRLEDGYPEWRAAGLPVET